MTAHECGEELSAENYSWAWLPIIENISAFDFKRREKSRKYFIITRATLQKNHVGPIRKKKKSPAII